MSGNIKCKVGFRPANYPLKERVRVAAKQLLAAVILLYRMHSVRKYTRFMKWALPSDSRGILRKATIRMQINSHSLFEIRMLPQGLIHQLNISNTRDGLDWHMASLENEEILA